VDPDDVAGGKVDHRSGCLAQDLEATRLIRQDVAGNFLTGSQCDRIRGQPGLPYEFRVELIADWERIQAHNNRNGYDTHDHCHGLEEIIKAKELDK